MSLSILGSIGAIKILEKAKKVLLETGHIGHAALDPYSSKFSLFGALAISCGAPKPAIAAYQGDVLDLRLSGQSLGVFMEVLVYLESLVDSDLEEWCEDASLDDALNLIERACDRIKISTI